MIHEVDGFSRRKSEDVFDRGAEYPLERFDTVESDMRGEDDIVPAEERMRVFQSLELRAVPVVFVDELLFFFEEFFSFDDIESGTREYPGIERFLERLIADDAATRSVDEQRPLFYDVDIVFVDEG
jgi:hypothetical protein